MDIYQTVTQQIIDAIEQGIQQTGKPLWHGQGAAQVMPYNFKTGKAYRGINVLCLWITANANSFSSPAWLTYRQAEELGGHVRKGEKSTQVVFYQISDRQEDDDESTADNHRQGILLKNYLLFNLDQIDGIATPLPAHAAFQGNEAAEHLLINSGASIIEEGRIAFYRPSSDKIHLPTRDRFAQAESFYAVALHELTHWTGHTSRLALEFGSRFGDESYAFEELIAELGASFLCADLGLAQVTMDDHARYIDGWFAVLRRDKKAIFTAASHAAKAHDYLMSRAAHIVESAA